MWKADDHPTNVERKMTRMKKSVLLFCLGFCLLLFAGCDSRFSHTSSYNSIAANDSVQMEIKPDSITPLGCTVTITSSTALEITYGSPYTLEKKKGDTWYVEGTDRAFDAIGIILAPKQTNEEALTWDKELSSGQYRIVKQFTSSAGTILAVAEFTL